MNPSDLLAASLFLARMKLGAREAGVLSVILLMDGDAQANDIQKTGLVAAAPSVLTALKNKKLIEPVPNDRGWTTYRATDYCRNQWKNAAAKP